MCAPLHPDSARVPALHTGPMFPTTPRYQVQAKVDVTGTKSAGGVYARWKAMLKPQTAGGNYSLSVACSACTNTTARSISDVTFGDVVRARAIRLRLPPPRAPATAAIPCPRPTAEWSSNHSHCAALLLALLAPGAHPYSCFCANCFPGHRAQHDG